jgi:hypothetical protein
MKQGMVFTTPLLYTKRMFKEFSTALLAFLLLIQLNSPANAGLGAAINLENPRVVPLYGQQSSSQINDYAGWSGYLYSSRIIFSAAHSNYKFDNNGKRILNEPPFITAGKPNSSAKDKNGRVRVIKTFVADFKPAQNDFIIYVLEKDLVPMQPSKLLTAEIEKELTTAKAAVAFHGYGEYRDRCAPGEKNPCKKDWNNPNHMTSELPRILIMNLAPFSDSYFKIWAEDQRVGIQETIISNPQACPGDSGGPITTIYKGDLIYLGMGLDAAFGYACGAGGSKSKENDEGAFGYFSPIHKHLDLLKEAEAFVKQQDSAQSKTKVSITCVKGKISKNVTGKNPKCPAGYKKK